MTGRPESYAALLRGINVGGNKKVPMAELREVMAGLGWEDVRTYVNSGNAVFTAGRRDTGELAAELEAAIAGRFGFTVSCLVRTAGELRAAADACPYPAADADPAKLLVLFLGREPDRGRLAAVDTAAYAPDEFRAGERELYCWFPQGMGRSKLPGALEKACRGTTVTGRNRRTVTRLLEMVSS
ncbi:DUF1697 domain-containing protein [Streptomyces verrucosisporus]|uniref:DUF1697 domain-containing protein n=1 Tax=Streptomyces verrucosisporus TaxID=1695161 RepID=UPI0019D12DA6|nr:DUF1697 domain-containing protein [Streptomyces verrucosisporus]MBN3931657.1 DUF1697 domain-containing protein [Streptomyces verrucosisporus]